MCGGGVHPLVQDELLKVTLFLFLFFLALSRGQWFSAGGGWIPVGMKTEASTEIKGSHTRVMAVETERKE